MRVLLLVAVMALLVALFAAPAVAAPNPNGTGQPSQDCGDLGQIFPGDASNVAGSTKGFEGNAEGRYANPDSQGGQSTMGTPGHDKVVSQYDVACFQQASRG